MLILLKLGKWLLGKGLAYLLMGAGVVGVFAAWLYLQRSYADEGERAAELAALQTRAAGLYDELEQTHERLVALAADIEESRKKLEAAEDVIRYLDGILNRIERFISMSAQQREESEAELARAREQKQDLEQLRKALLGEQSELRLERLKLSEAARLVEIDVREREAASTSFWEDVKLAWHRTRAVLAGALIAALLFPVAWKFFAFYIWAPALSVGAPIRLEEQSVVAPVLEGKGVSAGISMKQGQRLWLKEAYLQASDESLSRRTRFLLDWRIPATSLAADLVELVELEAEEGGEGSVTVSAQRKAEMEIAVLDLPEGCQVVARPSNVVGVLAKNEARVRIKRRWRLYHPQAWMTFQFRYFIFCGPGKLIVSGVRGVRLETLDSDKQAGRRSNQAATLGFTPDLGYGVVRAETFWSYFRGFNPLFDDVFRGKGVFLCQEISEVEGSVAGRFWSRTWNGILKVLGV